MKALLMSGNNVYVNNLLKKKIDQQFWLPVHHCMICVLYDYEHSCDNGNLRV